MLLNIRWGNTISIPRDVGEKIKEFQDTGELFSCSNFDESRIDFIAGLVLKNALETPNFELTEYREDVGLSLNLEGLLPQ